MNRGTKNVPPLKRKQILKGSKHEMQSGPAEADNCVLDFGEAELKAYLGDQYEIKDGKSELLRQWSDAPRENVHQVEDFYRSTDAYLFDLTQWHTTNRFPYAEVIGDFALRWGFKSLVDFGCGIGTDGLKLLYRGFDITFYDFRNPSTDYLKWRLQKRGLKAKILFAGEDELPSSDLTFVIDVVEHLPDPVATLAQIAQRAKGVVCHIPITLQLDQYPMHFQLDRKAIRSTIRRQGYKRVLSLSQFRYKRGALQFWEAPDFWVRRTRPRTEY